MCIYDTGIYSFKNFRLYYINSITALPLVAAILGNGIRSKIPPGQIRIHLTVFYKHVSFNSVQHMLGHDCWGIGPKSKPSCPLFRALSLPAHSFSTPLHGSFLLLLYILKYINMYIHVQKYIYINLLINLLFYVPFQYLPSPLFFFQLPALPPPPGSPFIVSFSLPSHPHWSLPRTHQSLPPPPNSLVSALSYIPPSLQFLPKKIVFQFLIPLSPKSLPRVSLSLRSPTLSPLPKKQ